MSEPATRRCRRQIILGRALLCAGGVLLATAASGAWINVASSDVDCMGALVLPTLAALGLPLPGLIAAVLGTSLVREAKAESSDLT